MKFDEIMAKGFALTPSKYIEFVDHDLDIDYAKEMARIQEEMRQILAAEKQSQKKLEEAFKGIGYEIETPNVVADYVYGYSLPPTVAAEAEQKFPYSMDE